MRRRRRRPWPGWIGRPTAFVANTGALDERVAFWLPGSQASVYLTDAGLTYRLFDRPSRRAGARPRAPGIPPDSSAAPAWVVRQDFVGAARVRPVATEASPPR